MSSNTEAQDTAGLPFPPPIAFIAALAVGFALDYVIPLHIVRTSAAINVLQVTGGVLAFAALVLALCAFVCFHLARTSPFPERPTTSLVLRGPFRFTRNPLYLAMALLHAGIAIFSNALWPLFFLLPAVLAVRFLVIAREERYLLQRFGAQYEAYCRSVRRWF
jgi:protein-S-isoprenylcysteine O-methyltransferase Ste14